MSLISQPGLTPAQHLEPSLAYLIRGLFGFRGVIRCIREEIQDIVSHEILSDEGEAAFEAGTDCGKDRSDYS
jgi:hypothetical protein